MLEKQQAIPSETRPAQLIMLEILKETKRICEKHDIKYWLDAGTLLGCVRHKGFIPWDDDLDIAMLREDYNKFKKIAPQELSKDYFFQTKETDKDYNHNFAKIRKKNTLLVEFGETENENYHQGIFIDIFPFDYYPSLEKAQLLSWAKMIRDKKKKYKKNSLKRLLTLIKTNIFLYPKILYAQSVKKKLEKENINEKYKNSGIVGNALNTSYITIFHEKNIFPLQKKIEFEKELFNIPHDYKAYISSQLGSDFMTLPPLHQRKVHAKKIILKIE